MKKKLRVIPIPNAFFEPIEDVSTEPLTDRNIRAAIAVLEGDRMAMGYYGAEQAEVIDVTPKLLE